jgi:uncharacterized protein
MRLLATLLFSSLIFTGTPANAQTQPAPPLARIITVTGDAEVKVSPDEAVMTWAVETFNKDLLTAKKQNDKLVQKVLEVTARNGVKGNDIKTDFINIEPRYQETPEQRLLTGFVVRKTMALRIREFSKLEKILSDALQAGVNNVYGLEFQTSKLLETRKKARVLALLAAKTKASEMAGALDLKLGDVLSIQENGGAATAYSFNAQNVASRDAASSILGSIAPGQISVTSSVTISFELRK